MVWMSGYSQTWGICSMVVYTYIHNSWRRMCACRLSGVCLGLVGYKLRWYREGVPSGFIWPSTKYIACSMRMLSVFEKA